MVVLDVLHRVQARLANDLAVRWNCKAGKCGSCSMEINGRPRLACMTRMNQFSPRETITVQPLKTFPIIKDLVTDVSWNYEQNRRIPPFRPAPRVRSALVRLLFHPPNPLAMDESVFAAMVQAVFTRRRKTLANALRAFPVPNRLSPAEALAKAGIDGIRRPETLRIEELVHLADALVPETR